jgi:hypothetical protein
MKSRFLVFIVAILCAFSLTAHAQIPVSIGGLELTPSSTSPVPGESITITARSYTVDIHTAKVTWYVDGKIVKSGVGETVYEVKAPSLGKKLAIDVVATTPDGTTVKAALDLGSGSVDVIFESDGYVPPFFKGKIPAVYQNVVKIIAVPHISNKSGVEYDPATLVYQWKKNGRALEDQSGYGKQSVTLEGDIVPRAFDLSVSVWPRDNSSVAEGYVSVAVGSPEINFYVDDPLYGPLFNRSVGATLRIGANKETTVLGVPFGFNKPRVGTGDLSWEWGLNGRGQSNLSSRESIILRSPDQSTGSSNIQLTITNTDKILQGATGLFSVIFSSTPQQNSTVTF